VPDNPGRSIYMMLPRELYRHLRPRCPYDSNVALSANWIVTRPNPPKHPGNGGGFRPRRDGVGEGSPDLVPADEVTLGQDERAPPSETKMEGLSFFIDYC